MKKLNWSWLCKIIGHNDKGPEPSIHTEPPMRVIEKKSCSRCNHTWASYEVEDI